MLFRSNVKLVCVEYTNTTATAVIVGTFATQRNPYTVQHTGLEITQPYTTTFLNPTKEDVTNGLNIRLLNQRCVESNYDVRAVYDFTAFFENIVLSTEIYETESEGGFINTSGVGMVASGYFDIILVNQKAGYTDNETYRVGGRIKWVDGGWSPVYHIGDITIDAGADTSLTSTTGSIIRARYIKASNIDYAFLPSGVNISDIEGIEIVRAECIPEVLATGYAYPAWQVQDGSTGDVNIFPFLRQKFASPAWADGNMSSSVYNFVSPDLIFSSQNISFSNGDKVFYSGFNTVADTNNYVNSNTNSSSVFTQNTPDNGTAYTEIDVEGAVYAASPQNTPLHNIDIGGSSFGNETFNFSSIKIPFTSTVEGALVYCPYQVSEAPINSSGDYCLYYNRMNYDASLIYFGTTITAPASNDYKGRYMQYFRPLTNKYGDKKNTIYIPTGTFIDTNATTADIWGGDTFIEKTTYKAGILGESGTTAQPNLTLTNSGIGFSFFSQNKRHSQMRNGSGGTGAYVFPFQLPTSGTWVENVGAWLEQESQENIDYSNSYTIRNNENAFAAYDSNAYYNTDRSTTIRWSDVKPIGSETDEYSIFRPENVRDLELRNGEIIHHEVINGELWSWQNSFAFMRQFFNNDGQLNTIDSSIVLIGDGSVMSRRGVTLSSVGATHKYSVRKGKSKGGDDIVVWVNTDLGLITRFGADGVLVLSDQFEIRRWLLEQSKILNV